MPRMCLVVGLLLALPAAAQEKSVAELKEEIARLKALNAELKARLEGPAGSVNLARTSLAAVSASSVSGSRALDNKFYGVLNAFDDGENWHNDINYTYWLSSGEPQPWIEIRFDAPVAVRAIVAEGAPAFSTRLFLATGDEVDRPSASGRLALESPLAGVARVRLTFATGDRGGNVKVHEVRILGALPPGADPRACRPRILMSRAQALAIARERFEQWRRELLSASGHRVKQAEDGSWVVEFHRGETGLFRVRIDGRGDVAIEPRVKLAPAPLAR